MPREEPKKGQEMSGPMEYEEEGNSPEIGIGFEVDVEGREEDL